MALRLQPMHPAPVQLPVTLLPLAVGADLAGRLTGNRSRHGCGRKAIAVAAVGAPAAAATGLIAADEANVEGDGRDMLITHRNLNFAATVVTVCMAGRRSQRERPDAGTPAPA